MVSFPCLGLALFLPRALWPPSSPAPSTLSCPQQSMAQTCVASTLNTAAASWDSSVGCEFRESSWPGLRGTAVHFPVALLRLSFAWASLSLGRLGAIACSHLAVSVLLPRISLSSEQLFFKAQSSLGEAFFCPGPGSRCPQKRPRVHCTVCLSVCPLRGRCSCS